MVVEIDQVETFVAVVRGGGFTKAGSLLHLSQPAVSRRLELLERELGAPLFERIRSGAILTEAGRTFLPHAEALLASMRDGLDSVRALHQVDRGMITLALVGTLASTTLTGCLQRFRDAHPRVELRLRTALSQEVSVLVRRGDATLGLRYGGDPHPDMVTVSVYDEVMMVVCSPRHRLAERRSVAPSALGTERWVAFPPRNDAFYEPYPWSLQNRLAAWALHPAQIVPDRQPDGAEADGGGGLRPRPFAGEQRRRGAADRNPARDARFWRARHDPGRADPSPARVSERRHARADVRAGGVAEPLDALARPGPPAGPAQENLSHRTRFCLYVGYMRTNESAFGQVRS